MPRSRRLCINGRGLAITSAMWTLGVNWYLMVTFQWPRIGHHLCDFVVGGLVAAGSSRFNGRGLAITSAPTVPHRVPQRQHCTVSMAADWPSPLRPEWLELNKVPIILFQWPRIGH